MHFLSGRQPKESHERPILILYDISAELVRFKEDGGHVPLSPTFNGGFEDVPRPTDQPERRHCVVRAITKFNPLQ
ncbi:hypothetical protein PR048_010092 [Dryococelus australis]|uniref:Uncharacterized protein n=1 Tax=Dryococelus australis TaxID=614101 RepID=A0ABQ9I1S2_9NEOP|nr:hypothetical protein PR048_010092 [Dryococelus australis]